MPLSSVVFTENVLKSFRRYQRTAYPFADPGLHEQIASCFLWKRRALPLFFT